jgi:hypothetical protein
MTPSILGWMCIRQTISAAVRDTDGKLVLEAILETKAETTLQFIHGLRGSLHVSFECTYVTNFAHSRGSESP